MQANFTADDDQLILNGYEPIPTQGKAAVVNGWQSGPIDSARIQAMRSVAPGATNTGLRTGTLVAPDIDIENPEHAAQFIALAESVFGYTPLQRFGSKGMMLCYRADTPMRKITITTDSEAKIEILGQGQQFVAFGTHPGTGKPFEWRGARFDEDDQNESIATPLNTPLDSLPLVTPAQVKDFAQQCVETLQRLGYSSPRVREAQAAEKKTRKEGVEEDTDLNIARAIEHLQKCVELNEVAVLGQLGNDTIYELACHLMDYFCLSEDMVAELMLAHWYPHCQPNHLTDDLKTIVSHAASYIQNEPGARALPPVAEIFRAALEQLPDEPAPGGVTNSDLGAAQSIVLMDENSDQDDAPIPAGTYIGQEFPPLRELIPIWCERNANTFLEGPAATQKSRAALQDAIALSASLPIMGQDVNEPCECLYLNYENSPEEMARRVHMICKTLQGSNKDAPVNPSGVLIWELRKHPRPIIVVKRDGVLITRFGRRFLSLIATRRNAGKHTLVIFDGLMDAIIFQDNTRNDDTVAMGLIRLLDSWCMEYDFTAYSIVHPSRSSERGNTVGSYATAWTTKPRAIQTFKRILSNFAGGGPKAKITEDTPLADIWYQRRVQKRSNGPEGERILLEYWKGGLRPHHPPKRTRAASDTPPPDEFNEDVPF